jgi:hypothetical protein
MIPSGLRNLKVQKLLLSPGLLIWIAACATWVGKPKAPGTDGATPATKFKITLDRPRDSTGGLGNIAFRCLPGNVPGIPLNLALQEASGSAIDDKGSYAPAPGAERQIDSSVSILTAQINVGGFRLKAQQEVDATEQGLFENLRAEKQRYLDAIGGELAQIDRESVDAKAEFITAYDGATDELARQALLTAFDQRILGIEARRSTLLSGADDAVENLESAADQNLDWSNSKEIDLLQAIASPIVLDREFYDGTYQRLEFYIHPLRGGTSQTSSLDGNSILIRGTYEFAGRATPFVIKVDRLQKIRLAGSLGLRISPNARATIDIDFNFTAWIHGLNLERVGPDPRFGELRIDKDNNPDLLQQFTDQMLASISFGKDGDQDGALASEEIYGGGKGTTESLKTETYWQDGLPIECQKDPTLPICPSAATGSAIGTPKTESGLPGDPGPGTNPPQPVKN